MPWSKIYSDNIEWRITLQIHEESLKKKQQKTKFINLKSKKTYTRTVCPFACACVCAVSNKCPDLKQIPSVIFKTNLLSN